MTFIDLNLEKKNTHTLRLLFEKKTGKGNLLGNVLKTLTEQK